ncbi:hypothetical protein OSB04_007712 [Centaurea solstitialis]|uniref:Chromo domain-containing protein n=1 Tax=Centaurea solstitialis TaxID=347529 RepID=A0AA38WIR3_9ASTR|nr:hypothetical protein OSB04_007712 [Centaurea solstitialis]
MPRELSQVFHLGSSYFLGKIATISPILVQYITSFKLGNVPDSSNQVVDSVLKEREIAVKLLQDNLAKAQQRMKLQADKHRSERIFSVGDWVYLKLQPYRQHSVAYKLNLPADSRIHNVFHVSLLNKKIGTHAASSNLPPVSETGEFIRFPLKILDKRMVKRRNGEASEVLVQWTNTDIEDSTWENVNDLQKRFPDFNMWAHYHP